MSSIQLAATSKVQIDFRVQCKGDASTTTCYSTGPGAIYNALFGTFIVCTQGFFNTWPAAAEYRYLQTLLYNVAPY